MTISDRIKQSITMKEVAVLYGFRVNRNHNMLCPFHADHRNPSLHVYPDSKGFYCFTCGAGGSVIDFVMRLYDLSLTEAIKKLNEDFGLGFDLTASVSKGENEEVKKNREDRKADLKQIEELRSEYDKALALWVGLDRVVRNQHPKAIGHLTYDWLLATAELPEAEYNLSCIEFELATKERN